MYADKLVYSNVHDWHKITTFQLIIKSFWLNISGGWRLKGSKEAASTMRLLIPEEQWIVTEIFLYEITYRFFTALLKEARVKEYEVLGARMCL